MIDEVSDLVGGFDRFIGTFEVIGKRRDRNILEAKPKLAISVESGHLLNFTSGRRYRSTRGNFNLVVDKARCGTVRAQTAVSSNVVNFFWDSSKIDNSESRSRRLLLEGSSESRSPSSGIVEGILNRLVDRK